jgi:hypothetical protein
MQAYRRVDKLGKQGIIKTHSIAPIQEIKGEVGVQNTGVCWAVSIKRVQEDIRRVSKSMDKVYHGPANT